jgi:hypothetical protein
MYRNSVFDIATSYGLDVAGFESRQRQRKEAFNSPKPFRRDMNSHPAPNEGYQSSFTGVKQQGLEIDYPHTANVALKMSEAVLYFCSTSIRS